jgi:hypothetical protein
VVTGGWKVEVPLTVSASMRTGGAWWTSRRRTALLGIFAIFFQAMLCAWHHHAHPFTLRSASGAVALAADGDQVPAWADDNCQFCFAISHHGAAPVDFFAPAPPGHSLAQGAQATPVTRPLAPYLLFRSRAPPRS